MVAEGVPRLGQVDLAALVAGSAAEEAAGLVPSTAKPQERADPAVRRLCWSCSGKERNP